MRLLHLHSGNRYGDIEPSLVTAHREHRHGPGDQRSSAYDHRVLTA